MSEFRLYRTPFCRDYWRDAASEMKSTRMLVLASLITALRVVSKGLVKIPVGPNLNITIGFLFNAAGSMIYGPVMAIVASAISDTIGALLFPSGTYFFPFIFEEIAGGVLFALFYYRTSLTPGRVILGRFSVTLVCNLLLSPVLLYYYYKFYMGKSYAIFSLPRMIKNAALFPLQCLMLLLLFRALLPFTNKEGLTRVQAADLKMTRGDKALLIVLTLLSGAFIALYYFYKKSV